MPEATASYTRNFDREKLLILSQAHLLRKHSTVDITFHYPQSVTDTMGSGQSGFGRRKCAQCQSDRNEGKAGITIPLESGSIRTSLNYSFTGQ